MGPQETEQPPAWHPEGGRGLGQSLYGPRMQLGPLTLSMLTAVIPDVGSELSPPYLGRRCSLTRKGPYPRLGRMREEQPLPDEE